VALRVGKTRGADRHLAGTGHGGLLGGAGAWEFLRVAKLTYKPSRLFAHAQDFPWVPRCSLLWSIPSRTPSTAFCLVPMVGQDLVQYEVLFSTNKVARRI
jgi:hypothetical protein